MAELKKEKQMKKQYESAEESGASQVPPLTGRQMRTHGPRMAKLRAAKCLDVRGQKSWVFLVGFKVPSEWRTKGRKPGKK